MEKWIWKKGLLFYKTAQKPFLYNCSCLFRLWHNSGGKKSLQFIFQEKEKLISLSLSDSPFLFPCVAFHADKFRDKMENSI